eukprot:TRINITY_DN23721_c0_g1_i1.p1 TRINITY_DN23721_c0_g1~~TRINITY_DN23721_c0_g1_i1.p1  ORF type:complete len:736 (+),score=240.37 TRINITY_DN23721_c0_g1_i1:82-2289(+)
MTLLLRWLDDHSAFVRGVRVPLPKGCSGITLRGICDAVRRDDPLREFWPPDGILLLGPADSRELTRLSADQLDCEVYPAAEPVKLHVRRTPAPRVQCLVPAPIEFSLTARHPATVDLLLGGLADTGQPAATRQRSSAVIDTQQQQQSPGAAATLRYFDPAVGGFCRVPGGDCPLPADAFGSGGAARLAVEPAPLPLPQQPAPGGGDSRAVSGELQGLCDQLEARWAAQVGHRGLPPSRAGWAADPWKAAVRGGVPPTLRGKVWCSLLGFVQESSETADAYRRATQQTFKWDPLPPDYDPSMVPFFGGELRADYFELAPAEVRRVRRVMCVLGERLDCVPHCPALVCAVCFFIRRMGEADACEAAWRLAQSEGIGKSAESVLPTAGESALAAAQLAALVQDMMPRVPRAVGAAAAADEWRRWFDSLFTCTLPLHAAACAFDVLLSEGAKARARIALAVTKARSDAVDAAGSAAVALAALRGEHAVLRDAAGLLQSAFALSLSSRALLKKREKARRQTSTTQAAAGAAEAAAPPPSAPPVLRRLRVGDRSCVCTDLHSWEAVFSWLPATVLGCVLRRRFAMREHGTSLTTLYAKCAEGEQWASGACLVLISAVPSEAVDLPCREVFGFFASEPLCPKADAYGDGRCFCFSLCPARRCYTPAHSELRNIAPLRCRPDSLFFGLTTRQSQSRMGTGAAVSFGNTLAAGESKESPGYGSPPFCSGSFQVLDLEVYSFEPD